ncbi:hypothetical protein E1B28_000328 [Marasmius oreades]|uniref:RING-CH-type domain-containing protein n=1 Tax=Marasmius oreades TaxID=181124 RepID=A0A9P8AEH2_9AGAR|nr:uncharacterized protein E1B28_000328 [Marasmius oreades]KAG7098370.1 hypothetical protein E1B28_000328 [Marasmius oreades]
MSDHVPTIDDLRVKLCFICREEELYDKPADPPRTWTHPCNCTLLAHEDCLLEWIKTAEANPSATTADRAQKCPQCGAKYQVESDLPFGMKILHEAFTKWNVSLGVVGKWMIVLVPVGLATGVALGTHSALAKYGSWAIREFFGNEVSDALFPSNSSKRSWTAVINLPLIPIGLVLYRFKPTFNLFPIITALLEWSNFQIRPVQSNTNTVTDTFLSWPPSPFTVGLVVLPLTRYLYGKCLDRVTRWALGMPRTEVMNATPEEDRFLTFRVRNGGEEHENRPEAEERPEGEAPRPEGAEPAEPAEAGNQNPANVVAGGASITINASPIGRTIGGALLIPLIAKHMGNLLLRFSKHSEPLRKLLAVRTPGLVSSVSPAPGTGGMKWSLVLRTLWGGGQAWTDFEPIWWRNTLGFGTFVLARDMINLLNLYLVKKEMETRRVKNRDFRDVDLSSLDVMPRRDS